MDFSWIEEFFPVLVRGLWCTISLLIIAATVGFLFAVPVGLARVSDSAVLRRLSGAFTTAIRGSPLLVQLYIVYYGLGTLLATTPGVRQSFLWPYLREGYWYVALALIVSVAAYWGELLHGGLRAVPRGELEAARAYAMPYWTMVRRIWLPSAFRILLPNLSSDCVLLLKSTSLASTVAVVDLLGAANQVRTKLLLVYEPLLLVAAIYLILATIISWAGRRLEMSGSYRAF